nr:MAG TPA: hypothetical protein [Caudoviricetes sp.]
MSSSFSATHLYHTRDFLSPFMNSSILLTYFY